MSIETEIHPATRAGQYYLPDLAPEEPAAYVVKIASNDGKEETRLMPVISGGCLYVLKRIDDMQVKVNGEPHTVPVTKYQLVKDCGRVNCMSSSKFDVKKTYRLGLNLLKPEIIHQ